MQYWSVLKQSNVPAELFNILVSYTNTIVVMEAPRNCKNSVHAS